MSDIALLKLSSTHIIPSKQATFEIRKDRAPGEKAARQLRELGELLGGVHAAPRRKGRVGVLQSLVGHKCSG